MMDGAKDGIGNTTSKYTRGVIVNKAYPLSPQVNPLKFLPGTTSIYFLRRLYSHM